jgi:hypothetical protein
MSAFFDWLGEYVPLGIMLTIWLVVVPFRVVVMLVLPYWAKKSYHRLNPVYEFFAFEDRL